MNEKTIDLQNRIITYIQNNMPITANGKSYSLEDLTFVPPKELNDIGAQMQMKYAGDKDLKGWVRGKVVIRDTASGKVISRSPLKNLVPIYVLTDRGTYMVNGVDKTIVSSMRLKPGIYTEHDTNSPTVSTKFRIDNNDKLTSYVPGMEFSYDPIKSDFVVEIQGKNKMNVKGVNFMHALGFSDQEIVRAIGNDQIADNLMRNSKETKSINDIYKALTDVTSRDTPERTRASLFEFLSANAVFGSGSENLRNTIGVASNSVNKDVIIGAVKKLFAVARADEPEDIVDDLRFKEVLDDNDLIMDEFENDFKGFKDDILKKLSTMKNDKVHYSEFDKSTAKRLSNRIETFMSGNSDQLTGKTSLMRSPEQINPLFMASLEKQVSQIGGSGGLSKDTSRNALSQRNLKGMGMNRLDPVETPESGSIGLLERVSQNAIIKNKTIYAPVLKVFGKEVSDTDKNTVELSPTDEFEAKVAYFDNDYVKRDGNKIIFTQDIVPARYHGKNVMIPVSQVQYLDKAAQNIFSYSANMIPFVNHDDGNRALMGTNMQRDAMVLKNRETPLVATSYNGTNETYEQMIGKKYGRPVRSSVDGIVSKITDTQIVVKGTDGTEYPYSYYKHFKTGQASINNELKVKAGDSVKKGQILAEGWQTVNGELALGVNARTGYLAYKGQNYEDGIVISRSFANKMTTEEVNEFDIEIPTEAIGGKGSGVRNQVKGYTTNDAIFSKLDDDGILKPGQTVKPGDVVAVYLAKKRKKSDGLDELLGGKDKGDYVYKEVAIPMGSYMNGKVERVNVVNNPDTGLKQKIVLTILCEKPMVLGDKISGKHGNKGTITKILDDEEMPIAEDGRPLDVIFSPLTIPSRKNPGQMYEVAAGLVAEKTGQRFVVNNFDKNEKNRVLEGLAQIGHPDGKMYVTLRERQPDGSIKSVVTENPVTVGNMYVMRLNKKSEDKIQARSNWEGWHEPDPKTFMPTKGIGEQAGEKHNPQSLGEMEMRALQAHGAVWNILESSTVKADGGGDIHTRMDIFEALKTGKFGKLDAPATPASLKVTADMIGGMGLKLQPLKHGKTVGDFDTGFDALSLIPMKGSELVKTLGKDAEVTTPVPLKAKVEGNDVAAAGGIMDPNIFGDSRTLESRQKWGYIKLATPIPNPVLFKSNFNPYSVLTGIKKKDLESLMAGDKVIVIDPDTYTGAMAVGPSKAQMIAEYKRNMEAAGLHPDQIISANEMKKLVAEHGEILWKAGGEFIQSRLDAVDVDRQLKETKKLLENAKGTKIDEYYKKYKMLETLKKNNMEASDLMMQYVPVTPAYLRPIIQVNNQLVSDDLNTAYTQLLITQDSVRGEIDNGYDLVSETCGPEGAARITAGLYSKVSNLMGTDQVVDFGKRKKYKGIKQLLGGKEGIIRNKLLKKRVDFSGRAVIGVDPNLNLDEVGIPIDMATTIYKPFIYKELMNRGYVSNWDEARAKLEQKDVHVRRVLDDIVKDRPAILNRQPSLHKQSIMAMKPVIKDTQDGDVIRSVQLNPLVVTGYNADFDGDQMAVHVPISDRAKEEAKKIMMPSENIISNANGKLVYGVRQEMVMGIYYMTNGADKPAGKPMHFSDYAQLKKAYLSGDIKTNQNVSIDNLANVTAGYALFQMLLPPVYKQKIADASSKLYHPISQPWDSKSLNGLFSEMVYDCEASNGKTISRMEIVDLMDDLKDIGFAASTKSGISLGINDLKRFDDVEKMYGKAIEDVGEENALHYTAPLIDAFANVGDVIEDKLKRGLGFKHNSSADIIMRSGARGNAQQFRKIVGTVGLGRDITGNTTEPVKSSFMDGLSPQEYWTLAADSRKGIYDRSVATFQPGMFTREMWSATQDMIITEKDCGTKDGILMAKNNPSLAGRVLLEDLVLKDRGKIAGKGDLITKEMMDAIYKDDSIETVKVRSAVKCKTVGGICQKCYGAAPGTASLVPIGTAVGVIASQSFGEPFTQGTLNTFHTGGMNSGASSGLPRVRQIMNLAIDDENKSTLATVSGTVTKIDRGMRGTYDTVYINGKAHIIPHINGEPRKIRVAEGDIVSKGDFLTVGNLEDIQKNAPGITNVDMGNFFKLRSQEVGDEQARGETQNLLLGTLSSEIGKSLGNGAIDQRHMEVMVSKMTGKVKVLDGGDSSYLKGSIVDKNEIDRWNVENTASALNATPSVSIANKGAIINKISRENYNGKNNERIVSKGEVITPQAYAALLNNGYLNVKTSNRPIQYENLLLSKDKSVDYGNQNFFSGLGTEDVQRHLAEGATMGLVDKLDDPRGRLMTGKLLNIGEGFGVARDIADSISTKMRNIFEK
jgi:DNA-directed RNA polymerase subunit beta'